jgi:hypothetical protein
VVVEVDVMVVSHLLLLYYIIYHILRVCQPLQLMTAEGCAAVHVIDEQ